MKSLIINADDMGADEARNRGIFEAIEAGRVTSVSVLANGDGFEDAMERWRISLVNKKYLWAFISTSPREDLSVGTFVSSQERMVFSWGSKQPIIL